MARGDIFLPAGWTMCQADGTGKPLTSTTLNPCSFCSPCRQWRDTTPIPSPPATDSLTASLLPNSRRISGLNFIWQKNWSPAIRVPDPFSRRMKRRWASSCKGTDMRSAKGSTVPCSWSWRPAPLTLPCLQFFGLSLGVTFPLNILLGIPLYVALAKAVLI